MEASEGQRGSVVGSNKTNERNVHTTLHERSPLTYTVNNKPLEAPSSAKREPALPEGKPQGQVSFRAFPSEENDRYRQEYIGGLSVAQQTSASKVTCREVEVVYA